MDISRTMQDFELKFSVCDPNILFERSLSQNFDLGPSLHFMSITLLVNFSS